MSIFFTSEDVDFPIFDQEIVKKVLKSELRKHKKRLGVLQYVFCSDHYLLDINLKFLEHDYLTDVITFDYSEELRIGGDVFISTEMVLNNSGTFEQTFEIELVRVMAHGFFHLLGYKDKESSERIRMRSMEDRFIANYIQSKL